MKSILVMGVGLVVALAPAGTAFAGPAEFGTGLGNAYGNCKHSSATGSHKPLEGGAGRSGNGGHVLAAKAAAGADVELVDGTCVVVQTEPVRSDSSAAPVVVDGEAVQNTDSDAG